MSGKWSNSNIPTIPGIFINFETTGSTGTAPGPFGVVAIPFTATWGPLGEITTLRSPDELSHIYGVDNGNGLTTSWVAREAFIGGASLVLGLRIAGAGTAKATKVLQDTTGVPVNALTLTAKHFGTRANLFGVTTRVNPLDGTQRDLQILEDGVVRESYTYAPTNITALAALINDPISGSSLVVASAVTSGVALATVTNTLLAGGADGATPTVAQYIGVDSATDVFEREGGFDVLSLDGVSDAGINTSLIAWTRAQNDAGRYVMTVVGGAVGETISQAITRVGAYDNEFVASLGGQAYSTTLPDGTIVARSTAQMAPRIAGAIAASGIAGSVTRKLMTNLTLARPLTDVELTQGIKAGLLLLSRRGKQVIVADGVTTFTDFTATKDGTFGAISSIRAMQEIGVTMDRILETEFLGQARNTQPVREAIIDRLTGYLEIIEGMGVLLNGSTVEIDTRYNNTGYSIFILVKASFGRELKRILITLRAPGL